MKIRERLQKIKKIIAEVIDRKKKNYDILYIVENADWCIKRDGEKLAKGLKQCKMITGISVLGVRNKIIHFGSFNAFITPKRIVKPHRSNKIIVTVYHIKPDDPRALKIKSGKADFVDIWHTACEKTRQKLLELGISERKIVIIPLAVDTVLYHPVSEEEKEARREKLGIKNGQIAIGSFQKDGDGWGEGMTPKLIKGPDIFCDVVERLSKKFDIYVVLTGPARGYVKKRLKRANIPYHHVILDNEKQVSEYYKVLDMYIIGSRVEGGPYSVLESMASGVPLLTTEVGMAIDVVKDEKNGMICAVEDVDDLVKKGERLIVDDELRKRCIQAGLETAKKYDSSEIPNKYYELIYKEFSRE